MKLTAVFELEERIIAAEKILTRLKQLATSITQRLDGLPATKSQSSPVESLTVKIVDTENRLASLEAEKLQAQAALSVEIANAVADDAAEILLLRYVHCMRFKKIAAEKFMSKRTVFRLHRKGVDEFNEQN